MPTEYLQQPDTKIIIGEVVAVVPQYHQTIVATDGGWQYSITRKAQGPAWDTLSEGDMVELLVYSAIPIVKEVLNVNKS